MESTKLDIVRGEDNNFYIMDMFHILYGPYHSVAEAETAASGNILKATKGVFRVTYATTIYNTRCRRFK